MPDHATASSAEDAIEDGNDLARSTSIDEAITRPGAVRINVAGAFVSDETTQTAEGGEHSEDIRLPRQTAVISHVAVDIGGSLAKIVYFSRESGSEEMGGRLNFLKFETNRMDQCLQFMGQVKAAYTAQGGENIDRLSVVATGGGAYKYYDRMKEVLGVEITREDEMECLITGLDFFITEIPGEVFAYEDPGMMVFEEARADIYPYLLVNIGSGVSMIKVSGRRQFERVGGTSLGGGTLWGLLSLLTGARTFDDMLALAEKGDNTHVDMLVKDIYGSDYTKIGLKSTLIASSFGKVFKMKRRAEANAEDVGGLAREESEEVNGDDGPAQRFAPEDISRSLLFAISNNIGQIAYLQSERHNLKNIYFGGSYIRGHRETMRTLSYAIKFWSKGEKSSYFLRHEGYLGAVGAFLKRQPQNWGRRNSIENFEA